MNQQETPEHAAANGQSADSQALQPVRVWDLPTRLFHWLLVGLLAVAWYTGGDVNQVDRHQWIGYSLLTLLVFRLAWGLVGPRHARFGSFLAGPRRVARYATRLHRRDVPAHAGHSPLGGWSVLLMLGLVLLQAITGLFTHEDVLYQHGPLYPAVSGDTAALLGRIHRSNFDLILAVIALHLVAVSYYWLWQRSNLIVAMVTGVKRLPPRLAGEAICGSRPWLALALVMLAAAAVAALVWLAPEAEPTYYF